MKVSLRPTTPADLPFVLATESDPAVSRWINAWPAERHSEAICRQNEAHLTVIAENSPVGFVLLAGLESPDRIIELRRIAITARGRGIGSIALAQTLELAFTDFAARRVWLDVLPGNTRARAVYERYGLAEDGLIPEGHPSPDGWLQLLVMSIRREDWEVRETPWQEPPAG